MCEPPPASPAPFLRWQDVSSLPTTSRPPPKSLCGTFQPTFLYEMLWNLGVAAFVVRADRRFMLGGGRASARLRGRIHHPRPHLDRDAPHRPGEPLPGAMDQRLRLCGGLPGGGDVSDPAADTARRPPARTRTRQHRHGTRGRRQMANANQSHTHGCAVSRTRAAVLRVARADPAGVPRRRFRHTVVAAAYLAGSAWKLDSQPGEQK